MLLLAMLDRRPGSLKTALEKALASLQAVLQATVEAAGDAAFAKDRDSQVPISRFKTRACLSYTDMQVAKHWHREVC